MSLESKPTPELSIVIGLIAGGSDVMRSFLRALEPSIGSHQIECLAPYDARLDQVEQLRSEFPWVTFLDCRSEIDSSQYGDFSREHHDLLRAAGLRAARGRLVALVEDHAVLDPSWVETMITAHQGPEAAIGGAVENGVDRLLNWAVYYCDFGRYQAPLPEGPAEFLSDANTCYKRSALERVRDLWADAFHETSVNWKLRELGESLRLEAKAVARQNRTGLKLGPALLERFVWGRSFAGTRAREVSTPKRWILAAFSPLLAPLLTVRILRLGLSKRRNNLTLLAALPLIFVLQIAWSLGEFTGYVTAAPEPARIKRSTAAMSS